MPTQNRVGIEVEYFLMYGGSEYLRASKYTNEYDEFPYIGEMRVDHGSNMPEVMGNYNRKLWETLSYLRKKKENLSIVHPVYHDIDSKERAECLRLMGYKEFDEPENIYGYSLLEDSNMFRDENDKVWWRQTSGLHIHFSSRYMEDIKIPDVRDGKHVGEYTKPIIVSRITKPVIKHFVERLDNEIFDSYVQKEIPYAKYRRKGYYQIKPWGFEYRSLPSYMVKDLPEILEFCFKLFEDM